MESRAKLDTRGVSQKNLVFIRPPNFCFHVTARKPQHKTIKVKLQPIQDKRPLQVSEIALGRGQSQVHFQSSPYRDQFRLGFKWEISARFTSWEKAEDTGDEFWREIRETKQTWRKHKVENFAPIDHYSFDNYNGWAVSLELNGMLMMWKIQHVKQDDTEFIRKIHSTFIPVTGLKCPYGNIFQPAYRDPGWKTEISGTWTIPLSHMNTSIILRIILEI